MALTDNLVAFWNLEDVNDSFGSNTLTNGGTVTFAAGKLSNAADFGSTNTTKILYIDSNAAVIGYTQFATAWTVAGWIYPQGAGTRTFFSCQVQSGSSQRRNFQLYVADTTNEVRLNVFDGTSNDYGTGTNLSLNTWYYITLTYNGSRFRVKINNGTPWTQTRALSAQADAQTGGWSLGNQRANGANGGNWYEGLIDSVGVWSREITDAEITELYNSGTGLQYPFTSGGTNNALFFGGGL